MARVTTLGPDRGQVEYRLSESAGCEAEIEPDAQTDYRLSEAQATLEWVGEGLAEVGIEPWRAFGGEADKDAARALMDGRDPRTGETLVTLKKAVDPRAKLPAADLVDAVRKASAEAGIEAGEAFADPLRRREWERLERGVAKDQDRYRVQVGLLSRVAGAAGVDLEAVYGAGAVAEARSHAAGRVVVGNRGFDVALDVPKSYSVLQALAPSQLSAELDRAFRDSVRETVTALEAWAGWGQRGQHGRGRTAERIETSGLLGWSMTHYTARPVGNDAPDPHLHVHLAVANMARGADGKWSAIGAGGRDLHRYAVAANAYLEARLRERTRAELGLHWAPDPRTGVWEVAAVPAGLRDVFSKRHRQIAPVEAAADEDGKKLTAGARNYIAERTREGKTTAGVGELRQDWRDQAAAAGYDLEAIARAATEAPSPAVASLLATLPARGHDVEAIAARVWHPEQGLCAHKKIVERPDVLAAVADAAEGIADLTALNRLADVVLAVPGYAVRLDADVPGTLTGPARYTAADIVEAETTILSAARTRRAGNVAVVDAEVTEAAIEAFELGHGFALSAEQRAVVTRLAGAGNGVDAVIGVAGSGKTTIMEALSSAHHAAGHTVAGASTAAIAAAHLQAETGIESRTIAHWLGRIERGRGLAGVDVLVVDEAAMADDRQIARLVEAAGASGTQIIGIGDPKQLRSPGVGSTFGDVHELTGGLTLADNRRQRHETEVKALAAWRGGDRRAVFDALADRDAVHAEARLDDVWAAMIGSWWQQVSGVADVHDRIAQHLMIAATNADVEVLNDAAQAIRADAGEIDPAAGRDYRIEGGRVLRLHVGDVVAARANDYDAGLLNGSRGVVTGIGADGTVTVAVRETGPDGPGLVERTVAERYIRTGDLQRGYCITAHRAQGQSAETVHASLTGMDAHAAYSTLTRHRDRVDVWLAADVVEDDAARARLGPPGTDTERCERAVDAYLTHLNRPETDPLAIAGLAEHRHHLDHRTGAARPVADKIAEARERAAAARELFGHPGEEPAEPAAADVEAERPWAHLDARELLLAYAQAHRAVGRSEQSLEGARHNEARYTSDQARYRAEVADAEDGRGAAAARLEERRANLARGAGLIDTIEGHRAAEAELDRAVGEDYRTARGAAERAEQNPIKLRLQGTSRAEQRQITDEARTRAETGAAERQQVREAMYAAEWDLREAIGGIGLDERGKRLAPDQIKPALADLETHWEARRAEAIRTDLGTVYEPAPPRTSAAEAAADLDGARQHRQGLVAEIGARGATDEGQAELDTARDQLRAEAAAAERARQAAVQAEAEARRWIRPPDHGPRPDRGPDIGGFSR